MIDLSAIRAELSKAWVSGRLLNEWLSGTERWPLAIACRTPPAGELLKRYAEVQAWIERLEADSEGSRAYRIEYETRRLQKLGQQRLPCRVWIDTREQALDLIGKRYEHERFAAMAKEADEREPMLRDWLLRKSLMAIVHAEDWEQLLDLCDWFRAHPQPNVYLRQIDLPGIDTKFIESRMGVLGELLDVLFPDRAAQAVASGSPRRRFAQRYGLKHEEPQVRLRCLDEDLIAHYRGISDLELPFSEFQRLNPPCKRVFITENKINGLVFPSSPAAIVIFGLGYGIEALQEVGWLVDKQIVYWGDIDTHGYHILSRLRKYWPQTQSLLMDETDLRRFIKLAGSEPEESFNPQIPQRLEPCENDAFIALRENRYGLRVRIEQERLPYSALEGALAG